MRKGPIPRSALKLLRIPIINRLSLLRLRNTLRKRKDLFPRDVACAAEAFFIHDLIGNFDFKGSGKPDSFRISVNNTWFDQRITGLALALNGKVVPQKRVFLRVGEKVIGSTDAYGISFEAGQPIELIVSGKKLRSGLHVVEIELSLELESIYMPVPILMKKGNGSVVVVEGDPADLDFDIAGEGADLHYIPHVHYDVEWLETSDVFEKVGAKNILEALRLLEANSEYTYTLDQLPQLRFFEKRHPERFGKLVEYVKEGRVEIANGMVAEPDTNLVGGESLVMGSVLFQKWAKKTFGKRCKTGWLIDSFGMSAQLPQIFAKSGTQYLAFSRELEEEAYQSEFIWEGLDGSKLLCHYMPLMYFAGYPLPNDRRRAFKRLSRIYAGLREHATGNNLMVPAGVDHGKPQAAPLEHIPAWNKAIPKAPISFSTPARFFGALDQRKLETRKGEFQRVFEGVWSARPHVKQRNREAEALMQQVEINCTLAALSGMDYPHDVIARCWETLLENQFHDRICSCITDDAAENLESRYKSLLTVLGNLNRSALEHLLGKPETAGTNDDNPGVKIVAFNSHSFERSEWIEVEIEDAQGLDECSLLAPEGPIEHQVLDRRDYFDGRMKSLRIGFVAKIPATGYRVFRFVPAPDVIQPIPGDLQVRGGLVTGRMWRVKTDMTRGTVSRVDSIDGSVSFDLGKTGSMELERDRGSLMASLISKRGKRHEKPERVFFTVKGPLMACLRTEGTIGKSRFTRDIRFYRDLRRMDVELKLDYRDPGHRLRAVVDTGAKTKTWSHEVPYGVMERGARQMPVCRWADAGNGNQGLAILNHGIAGHERVGKTAYLSLLRSQDKIHLFEAGPGAFCLGENNFRFAILPHGGGWRQAAVWRNGSTFSSPVQVFLQKETSKTLGKSRSFVTVKPSSVQVSAMRMTGPGEVEMRLVECSGQSANASLKLDFPVEKAEFTDMLGRSLADLPVRGGVIEPAMGAFEILTLRLKV